MGDKKDKKGKEPMTATGRAQTGSPRALAAPEGVKRNVKRTPQLGSVPAKKCSLLVKKMKLTSLSLAAGVECPWERGAGLLAPNLGTWPLGRPQLRETHRSPSAAARRSHGSWFSTQDDPFNPLQNG